MKKVMLTQLALLFLCVNSFAADYSGNNMLSILGASKNSQQFKDYQQFWMLDKDFQNAYGGMKLNINDATGKVESVLIICQDQELAGTDYHKFASHLPFGISMSDDTTTLNARMNGGYSILGKSTLKFNNGDIAVEATFNRLYFGQISSLKFYVEARKATPIPSPVKPAPVSTAPRPATPVAKTVYTVPANTHEKDKIEQQRRALESTQFNSQQSKTNGTQTTRTAIPTSPFKKGIMDVFRSWRSSQFGTAKLDSRNQENFWNYKYAFNTTIKIPGESYNMVYNFPFASSQADFVSVIKEGYEPDQAFEGPYQQFELMLKENFTPTEGWVMKPIGNRGKLQGLEFKNDKLGSVILDYTRNPQGRGVLFLRFLLFSD
ncbi:MAG TPA: hypothetical protein VG603_09710 [Chitinophagales bacterium]|nr:hypothetical protein [Chitinophagales bacterium]